MDWEEFQVCIKTLGKQAGIDVQSEEDERFKVPPRLCTSKSDLSA